VEVLTLVVSQGRILEQHAHRFGGHLIAHLVVPFSFELQRFE
jgi:hypothetical protein